MEKEQKVFPGRGRSLAAMQSQPSQKIQNNKIQISKPTVPTGAVDLYQIKKTKDDSSVVVLSNQAKKPNQILMPGVGKIVGALQADSNIKKTSNIQVLNPHKVVIDNNMKRNVVKQSIQSKKTQNDLQNPSQMQLDEKWRCKICKFANPLLIENSENDVEKYVVLQKCQRCRDPKQVLIEDLSLQTGSVRLMPSKPTLQAQRVNKQENQKPQFNNVQSSQIKTLQDLNAEQTSDASKGMHQQRRAMKESEQQILKNIAQADNVNKGLQKGGMGNLKRIQDREYVKNVRDPAKFNAMTYAKEYNGNLSLNN